MNWIRFFKNPKTALAGSAIAILGGVIAAVSTSNDPVSTTLIVTSALSALGGLGGNYFSSASEKLFFNKTTREEDLQNGDLTRAVGRAIFLLFLQESKNESYGDDCERLEIIGHSDESLWENIVLGIEDKENPRFELSEEDLRELAPDFLTHYVAAETGKINEIETLTTSEWRNIVEKLAEKHGLILQFDTSIGIAQELNKHFAEFLRKVLVNDFAENGKAFASFQIRILGEILYYVKENHKTNRQILEKAELLDERTGQILSLLEIPKFTADERFWQKAFDLQTDILDNTKELLNRSGKAEELLNQILEILKNPPVASKIPCRLPVSLFPSRVKYFSGRKDVLKAVKKSLKDHKTASLHGTHGLGKSSVATEFAYRNEKSYAHVLFIRAFGAEFDRYVREIVKDLNFPVTDETKPGEILKLFQNWLAENDNWLLILDNVDNVQAIGECKFTTFGGDVIFTSNKEAIHDIGNRVPLENMETDEAASLLLRYKNKTPNVEIENVSEDEANDARKVAEKFGNSPLAMSFVGSYLANKKKNFAEFLRDYHQREKNLLENYPFTTDYFEQFADSQKRGTATAFLNTFDLITTPKDDSEREILLAKAVKDYLKICVFLSAEDMPEEFFVECLKKLDPQNLSLVESDDFIDDVKERLYEYSLFTRDSGNKTLSTHRLVQEIMSFEIKDEETALITTVSAAFHENVPRFEFEKTEKNETDSEIVITIREQFERYLAHLEKFIDDLKIFKTNSEDITKADNQTTNVLSYKIGVYYRLFGQYGKAEKYYLVCRDICEKIYGNEHQETAASYNNLGIVYYSLGEYEKAEENHQNALRIYLNTLGENHPNTASSYNNLGNVYDSLGEYEKAEENHQNALRIRLNILGENHPDTAASYNNLGNVYRSQGDYKKAEENHQNALRIRLKKLGEDHPETATSYNNLGNVYYAQGEYEKAEKNYQNALRIRLKKLGEDHPDTAASYNNLGAVYYAQGEYEKAEKNYQNALRIRLNIFGENHPLTASSYNNLGNVYRSQGDYKKAEENHQNALRIRLKKLGEDHPETATSYNNLGLVYYAQGEYEKAEKNHQNALRIRLKKLGEDHPDTAGSYNNLGNVYYAQGEYEKAEKNHQNALRIKLNNFGENNPSTAMSYGNLGVVYENLEKFAEAERYYLKALEIYAKFLPENHPDVQRTNTNLEEVREKMGK